MDRKGADRALIQLADSPFHQQRMLEVEACTWAKRQSTELREMLHRQASVALVVADEANLQCCQRKSRKLAQMAEHLQMNQS